MLIVTALFTLTLTASTYVAINKYRDYFGTGSESKTMIIFGGGVVNGNPLPLLEDRLKHAIELDKEHNFQKIIVSGDNRTLDYNEPTAMMMYLEEHGIRSEKIQPDFAGRSTYETCERAKKVFKVNDALLVSESTHLPRALYLCRHFGITAYGSASDGEASKGLKLGQRWREVLARNKAFFNVYIKGEETVF